MSDIEYEVVDGVYWSIVSTDPGKIDVRRPEHFSGQTSRDGNLVSNVTSMVVVSHLLIYLHASDYSCLAASTNSPPILAILVRLYIILP